MFHMSKTEQRNKISVTKIIKYKQTWCSQNQDRRWVYRQPPGGVPWSPPPPVVPVSPSWRPRTAPLTASALHPALLLRCWSCPSHAWLGKRHAPTWQPGQWINWICAVRDCMIILICTLKNDAPGFNWDQGKHMLTSSSGRIYSKLTRRRLTGHLD